MRLWLFLFKKNFKSKIMWLWLIFGIAITYCFFTFFFLNYQQIFKSGAATLIMIFFRIVYFIFIPIFVTYLIIVNFKEEQNNGILYAYVLNFKYRSNLILFKLTFFYCFSTLLIDPYTLWTFAQASFPTQVLYDVYKINKNYYEYNFKTMAPNNKRSLIGTLTTLFIANAFATWLLCYLFNRYKFMDRS